MGHITTMMNYAQIHIFDASGHYKGRLLLILILHNVMHDITSTLHVDVAPSARFTQNGRPMSIAGGRQEWFGYYWLCVYVATAKGLYCWYYVITFKRGRRVLDGAARTADLLWNMSAWSLSVVPVRLSCALLD